MYHQSPDNSRGKLYLLILFGLLLVFLLAGSGPKDNSAESSADNTTKISNYRSTLDSLLEVNRALLEQNKLIHSAAYELISQSDPSFEEFETAYQGMLEDIEARLKTLEID